MLREISNIRLKDFELFSEVARARSIRETARRVNLTSGQVSKAISNLERQIGTKLFRRSVAGVLLTSQGTELNEIVRELLTSGEKIESMLSSESKKRIAKTIAIAGTSFLNTHFSTPITCRFAAEWPLTTFRFLDLAPDQIVSVGLRGGFEIAVHYGSLSWPGTWTTTSIGASRWVLCARNEHPLPKKPSLKEILQYPFVIPTYWTAEGLVRGNDHFPVSISKRRVGFETATADAAIPILFETDQIAFLPELLVRRSIQTKRLREIRNHEINLVKKELFLSAKSDAVPASIFQRLSTAMGEALVNP